MMPVMQMMILSGQRFERKDFSGQDLRRFNLSKAVFHFCNFDKANLSEVDCSGSDFMGSTFRDTTCYRTNFKDCKLAGVVFEPKDAYGVTFSFTCETFTGMRISQLWFYSWLMMAAAMVPIEPPTELTLTDKLIAMIGAERYVRLKALFARREI
jgi:uncharacterized protein YjbI with pentapeptide repeats